MNIIFKLYKELFNIYTDFYVNYLKYNNCNPELLLTIQSCKLDLLEKGYFVELPIVEISIKSIKSTKSNESIRGNKGNESNESNENIKKEFRYSIPIVFGEFIRYPIEKSKLILKTIYHDNNNLLKYINDLQTPINEKTDIIFGIDCTNKIGKIYFDQEKYIICYESGGRIKKYYKKTNNIIVVYDKDKIHGIHYRNRSIFNNIYWENKYKNIYTSYVRPLIHLFPITQLIQLSTSYFEISM